MSGLHEVGEQVSDGCRLPGERVPAVRWLHPCAARLRVVPGVPGMAVCRGGTDGSSTACHCDPASTVICVQSSVCSKP